MRKRSDRSASLLVRLYPRQWRERFPDFVKVLTEELAEHPRGVHQDVVRAAVIERLREGGVLPRRPADQARSGLALIYAALVPFSALAMGISSQLRVGLAFHSVATPAVLGASSLLLTVGTLGILIALPLAVVLLMAQARRTRKLRYGPFVRPGLAFIGSLTLLTVAGWGADRSGWYSPAAVALPHRGPGHLLTLWVRGIVATITPAWIHPGLFARMPTGELAAALLAPVAGLVAALALFRLVVRLPVGAPGRVNIVLAACTSGMMLLSVAASGRWLLAHPRQQGATPLLARGDQLAPGHTGWVVVFLLAALAATALVGMRRVLRVRPDEPTGGVTSMEEDISPAATGRSDGSFSLLFGTK